MSGTSLRSRVFDRTLATVLSPDQHQDPRPRRSRSRSVLRGTGFRDTEEDEEEEDGDIEERIRSGEIY